METSITILGAGGIGRAAALLLASSDPSARIYLGDVEYGIAEEAAWFVRQGANRNVAVYPFVAPGEDVSPEIESILTPGGILLDCLPGTEAPRAARLARKRRMHYANLTEHVAETECVLEIAHGAETAFVLQCGLAPGYVDVAAKALFARACEEWEVSRVRRVLMRVGALSTNAAPPSFYGWTWSPAGVVTEYLEPALVVRDGLQVALPSLSDRGLRVVQGVTYEEALTSGGAADLPAALAGRVEHLDYMTLRWPGHYDYVASVLAETASGPGRMHLLQERMEKDVPRVDEDLVVLYVAVEGVDRRGLCRRLEHAVHIRPVQIGGASLRAIQASTAAGLAEVTRLIAAGRFAGPVLQSQIPAGEFLNGPIVASVYGRFPLGCAAAVHRGAMPATCCLNS
jgi:hypothetical protein